MSLRPMSPDLLKTVAASLEKLNKSFAAGYQGLANAGRTGVSALAIDSVDPVMKTITMTEDQFLLTKDIKTMKATQTVFTYKVKTAVQSDLDLAGTEAFLPAEDQSQYISVSEVLKVYGIRKGITQLAQLTNDAGGYVVDLEKENDENAALAMAQAMERDLYYGGDYYMDAAGGVDPFVANTQGNIRQVRGIQANVREGDLTQRGIPGDFTAYGNSRSVVFDRKGGVLERSFLDKVATAVQDNMGQIDEGHCTSAQLMEFRATFFPMERADVSALYAIRGPAITNEPKKKGITVDTVCGPVDFIPNVFKYSRNKLQATQSSVGNPPQTPTCTGAVGGAASGSGFALGQAFSYKLQAINMYGRSYGSTAVALTTTTADAYNEITVTSSTAGVEYFEVYRTTKETGNVAGKEQFIGKIVPSRTGSTIFRDNGKLVPGYDSVLFLPKNSDRAQLALIGNLLNKMDLGLQGLGSEKVYSSYFGCVVVRPRSLSVVDNVAQERAIS